MDVYAYKLAWLQVEPPPWLPIGCDCDFIYKFINIQINCCWRQCPSYVVMPCTDHIVMPAGVLNVRLHTGHCVAALRQRVIACSTWVCLCTLSPGHDIINRARPGFGTTQCWNMKCKVNIFSTDRETKHITGVHPCSCKSQSLPAPDNYLTNRDSRAPCHTCMTRWVGRGGVGIRCFSNKYLRFTRPSV